MVPFHFPPVEVEEEVVVVAAEVAEVAAAAAEVVAVEPFVVRE
ncbi:hypothetical protein AGMMS4957_09530 [Bacteroidia bacterium]|nr:hypothetical protein AGMMS4957_09530 [Bacteroidia bacterium]